MARPIRNIDVYLPLDYNDGPPIPESKYVSLQQELLTRFGGITSVCSADMLLGVREINNGRSPYGGACGAGPYKSRTGLFEEQCDLFHFWSPHSGGAYFLFADGSVHFLSYNADAILPTLATRAGGEAVSLP